MPVVRAEPPIVAAEVAGSVSDRMLMDALFTGKARLTDSVEQHMSPPLPTIGSAEDARRGGRAARDGRRRARPGGRQAGRRTHPGRPARPPRARLRPHPDRAAPPDRAGPPDTPLSESADPVCLSLTTGSQLSDDPGGGGSGMWDFLAQERREHPVQRVPARAAWCSKPFSSRPSSPSRWQSWSCAPLGWSASRTHCPRSGSPCRLSRCSGLLLPIPGIGATTAVVAVTFYAVLPVLRNAVVGLAGRRQDAAGVRARHGHGRRSARWCGSGSRSPGR